MRCTDFDVLRCRSQLDTGHGRNSIKRNWKLETKHVIKVVDETARRHDDPSPNLARLQCYKISVFWVGRMSHDTILKRLPHRCNDNSWPTRPSNLNLLPWNLETQMISADLYSGHWNAHSTLALLCSFTQLRFLCQTLLHIKVHFPWNKWKGRGGVFRNWREIGCTQPGLAWHGGCF